MMIAETKRCLRWTWLWAAWACVVLCQVSQAYAQQRVLVVNGKGVSAEAQRAVHAAVEDVGELVEARAYLAAARARHAQPTSDATLRELGPKQRATLIIATRRQHGKLVLSYRDGKSGAVVGEDRFAMPKRGKTDAHFQSALVAGLKAALAGEAPPAAAPPSAAEEAAEEEPEPPPPPAAQAQRVPAPEPEPEPEPEPGAEPTNEPEPPPAAASAERLSVAFSLGAGVAARSSTVPTREGTRDLSTGAYPGLALSVAVQGMLGEHFHLEAAANYRTSVGLSGVETPPLDSQRKTSLRSHTIDVGVAPGYRFGAADSVVLQLFLGWMFQGLRPVVDLSFPAVSWHGVVVRPELILPFGDGAVRLRIAPELVAVAGIYTTLTGRTGLAHSGLAFGGEVALDIRLASWLLLGFDYRESHMSLGSSWGADLTDVLRFANARLILVY